MALSLVPRSARALADHLNSIFRVLKGVDPDSVAIRLPSAGTFQVRHSVTAAPVLNVSDAGIISAINGANISTGSITSNQIADGTIVGADIANGTITSDKLTGLSGVPANSITTAEIANGTIQAADIAPGQIPTLLGAQTVAAPTPYFLFDPIPGTYRHLHLEISGRSVAAVVSEVAIIRFNYDAATTYYGEQLTATGATATAAEHPPGSSYMPIGSVPGASSSHASWFGGISVKIPGYAVTSTFKPVISQSIATTGTSAGQTQLRMHGGVWAGATAIVSLAVSPLSGNNWAAGSVASLYGLP